VQTYVSQRQRKDEQRNEKETDEETDEEAYEKEGHGSKEVTQ
jgi:hypothetical protein